MLHPMPTRATRRELNQVRFREANERLHDAVEDQVQETQPVPFLCECADDDCLGTVTVLLNDWEAVASRHNHFSWNPGTSTAKARK
jgi:hypothetical protein